MASLRAVHVFSELYPFVKTGGLGDVAAALPPALRKVGIDARQIVPGYPALLDAMHERRSVLRDPDLFGGGPAELVDARLGQSDVPTYVVECPGLWVRAGGPYQDERGAEHPDNARRFAALGWAARWLSTARGGDLRPDVVHVHDWQGGLALPYVKLAGGDAPACVATIHSIAYPGAFPFSVVDELALPKEAQSMYGVEFFGRVSFLKAALYYADKITTVSPTYASELQRDGLGGGFEGLLRARRKDLVGILNGVDYAEWNPATDPHLPEPYSPADLSGKTAAKLALQRRFGLEADASRPLFGVVSRLVWQKGIDWVVELIPWLVEQGAELVVFGSGDADLSSRLAEFARKHPSRIGTRVGYDEALAHAIIGGSDSLLVPSRTEPCGLTQLYALRYGSAPVVRRTGGLADTVVDATSDAMKLGTATGFSFEETTAAGLRDAMARAMAILRDQSAWRRLQLAGMARDFGWERSARQYAALYESLVPQQTARVAGGQRPVP